MAPIFKVCCAHRGVATKAAAMAKAAQWRRLMFNMLVSF
jgi:hypothetical protein